MLEQTANFFDTASRPDSLPSLMLLLIIQIIALYFIILGLRKTTIGRRILRPYARFFSAFFDVDIASDSERSTDISDLINAIRREISSKEITLSESSQAEIVEYFRQALEGNFSDEIRNALISFTKSEVSSLTETESVNYFMQARRRLERFGSSVSARGLVSLLLGFISAGGALIVLYGLTQAFSVETLEKFDYKAILLIAISRVSLAIFIIFISYFFLSLYRRSLDDAHRYQAELTNIDSWISALVASMRTGDEKLKAYAIARLFEVDRNIRFADEVQKFDPNSQTIKISSEIFRDIINGIAK